MKGTTELMTRAIQHRGFAFLNILSPCVTWRGEEQHKELRAKVRAVPAGHDVTNREAALRLTDEPEIVTTGVLYDVARPTLLEELALVEDRARGVKRGEFLAQFA